MRKATRWLLWAFVFTVPWDVVPLPGFGAVSRLVGIATIGLALLTKTAERRFRKPDPIIAFSSTFIAFSALSLMWTISFPDTLGRVVTYVQLLASVFVIYEFARTRCEQESLLVAFCLGELVPLVGLLRGFSSGVQSWRLRDRYTAQGFNADDLGLTLVIGIPIAWHLMVSYSGTQRTLVRAIAVLYFVVAPVAVLLTGTRGAVLAGAVALSIVPFTAARRSLRFLFLTAAMLVVVAGAAVYVVPQDTWARVLTIKKELLEGGRMTGRSSIWSAGLSIFPERPLLGVGAGAYGAAIEPLIGQIQPAHNLALGVLVEQGIVGASIYIAILGACAFVIVRLPSPDRTLWAVLMLAWLVGVMSLNWEYRKVTWLLFGLMAAQGAAETARRRLAHGPRDWSDTIHSVRAADVRQVYSRAGTQRAIN